MDNYSNSSTSVEQLKLCIKLVNAPARSQSLVRTGGTARTSFLPQQVPQLFVLRSDISALLPADHFAYTVIEAIKQMDLSEVLAKYEGKRGVGRHAYDPHMMLALIIYCYHEGRKSTRAIEQMAKENIPCRVITGGRTPDHDTIANFLAMHRQVFDGIFQQTVVMAERAGLVALDHVAIDGSKVKANASKRKAMSYGRMRKQIRKLTTEIRELQKELQLVEKQTDTLSVKNADYLRQEICFRQERVDTIVLFKKKLEQRVQAKAQAKAAEKARLKERGGRLRQTGKPRKTKPKPEDQINFTDEESRIMPRSGQFEQSYNAQTVVDSRAQIIVAYDVVQDTNDKRLLEPMLKQVLRRTGKIPNTGSADAGYFSEESLTCDIAQSIELLVPPDRESHPRKTVRPVGRIPADLSVAARMRRKLSTRRGKETYARRKCIVEPVFGQIKESVMDFDQFSWRGLQNVRCEWALVCAVHNLIKLHRLQPLKQADLSAA